MYAMEFGFFLIIIVLLLLWLLLAKTYTKLGSFVSGLFNPFKQPEQKENKTNEQPTTTADNTGSGFEKGNV